MTEPEGLRERKKRTTRRAIADAALSLAVAHGPEAVTIDGIAAAADVSPRTIFNHFASKDDAILGIDVARDQELCRELAARPIDEPVLASLRAVLTEAWSADPSGRAAARWTERMQLLRDHPSLFPSYVAAFAALERALVTVVAERTGADAERDLGPSLQVAVAITTLRVVANRWVALERTRDLGEMIDEAFDQLARGISSTTLAGI
jgi:AcrR family transcriptional regulator